MNILYHLTIPPPPMPDCEAVSQEISALRKHFGGDLTYLNPNGRLPLYVPRIGFGFHRLGELHAREIELDVHHFFNPDPFPFPILRLLRRPVIYSLTGGVGARRPNLRFFSSLAAITVADERSLERLSAWGLDNVALIRPGIDTERFSCTPLVLRSEIHLMVGSAPWTRAQFRSKGIDALLEAARRTPRLHLTFLWRGVLVEDMERRVRQMGLGGQVRVLNRRVDVNRVLANVHASIGLATDASVVRPYPHSLIESLAAGKPVLVSQSMTMADYVRQRGCGQVIERVTAEDILAALEVLSSDYDRLQQAAYHTTGRDFTQESLLASLGRVYERVLAPRD